jgi:hypothetical protein
MTTTEFPAPAPAAPVPDAVLEAYHQCLDAAELLGRLCRTPETPANSLREALSATRAAVAAVRFALVEDHGRAAEGRG